MAQRTASRGSATPLLAEETKEGNGPLVPAHVDRKVSADFEAAKASPPLAALSFPDKVRRLWRKYATGENAALSLALVVLVGARTCDQTLYYRLNFSYRYYVWYFASVILAVPFSWLVVWGKMAFTKDITPEMRAFPQYKFCIMGLFDTLFNIFSTFPVQHLGGDLSNALAQTILPVNMLGSFLFLKTRFHKVHYWGALLVFYGILVRLSPSLGTPAFAGSFGWVLLTFVSQFPSAASNVYKEIGLKGEVDLDVWYANAWIGVYQMFWGILSVWTIFVPAFVAPHPPLSLHDVPTFFSNANKCFVGQDVDIFTGANTTEFSQDCMANHNLYNQDTGVCTVSCDVHGAPIAVFSIYILFNITYNTVTLYVFKKGSSVLSVVVNAIRLPLVDALNTIPFISGQAQESFGKYDGFALFVLLLATWIYYSEDEEIMGVDTDNNEHVVLPVVSPTISSIAAFRHKRVSTDATRADTIRQANAALHQA